MNETCGCCDGTQQVTPIPIANRPGLDALHYRVGTHASFLETMLARLSSMSLRLGDLDTIVQNPDDKDKLIYPLEGLTTRSPNDPVVALLDAWAIVADVLTFYQERIANEGYLRTATEHRSILELARLVGYTLRPGVAASVYLAYTLEKDHNVVIQPGNRAQSIPGPGELPQSFETAEKLEARFAWNALKLRLTRPQYITQVSARQIRTNTKDGAIYFKGTATNLKSGDPLLFVFDKTHQVFFHILTVETQTADSRTRVTINPTTSVIMHPSASIGGASSSSLREIVERLQIPPSLQPRNTQRLERTVSQTFTQQSDIHLQLLVNFSPIFQSTLYTAIINAPATIQPSTLPVESIQALRVKAAPFGHNAPLKQDFEGGRPTGDPYEWLLIGSVHIDLTMSFEYVVFLSDEPYITFFGGWIITKVEIIVKRGSVSQTDKTQALNGKAQTVTLDLGDDGKLEIVVTAATDATPSQIKLTYTGRGVTQVFSLTDQTVETPRVGIQIDPDAMWVLDHGRKQEYSTGQHQIKFDVDFSENYRIKISSEVHVPATNTNVLPLDSQYDKIIPGLESWVVIERPDRNYPGDPTKSEQIITLVEKIETVSMAAYGVTGRVTQLTLKDPWLFDKDVSLSVLRRTTVYAQSVALHVSNDPQQQVEEPATGDIEDITSRTSLKVGTDTIELDRLYDGLKSGQRVIVSGERADITSEGVAISGIRASELVMLKGVTQDVQKVQDPADHQKMIDLPGDQKHTSLHLAKPLAYTYKRDTVTIYANVVRATHGETRNEVLGSGDGSKVLQQFPLRQSPLTYVSAATPSGVNTTLEVRVNDLLWHEANSLVELAPTSRKYVTATDEAQKTQVIFGNGIYGARLPTGVENVKARYRTGIGKSGNVQAEQISLLSTKPLGVKAVINPLRASGGADPESRDQARRNVPIALLALDRLVSVQDYEAFARNYAGIGKASAVSLSNGRTQLVNLTIVGLDNIPIDITSDLYLNLLQSLHQFGDPHQPLRIDLAEVLFLVISLRVRMLPDHQFESVVPNIRTRLLDAFSFDSRQLGQPAFQSEVLSVIQGTTGVDYVDLQVMGLLARKPY